MSLFMSRKENIVTETGSEAARGGSSVVSVEGTVFVLGRDLPSIWSP
jgi:hypothetical protein